MNGEALKLFFIYLNIVTLIQFCPQDVSLSSTHVEPKFDQNKINFVFPHLCDNSPLFTEISQNS